MSSDREARATKEVADAQLRDGHFRDAVEQYSQALGCAEDAQLRSTLLANRCLALLRAGRLEDALRDAQSALQLRPRWHKAHLRLAQCQDALRQTHAAIASYKRALELEPGLGESVSRALASLELKESRSLCRLSLSARHAVYGVALHPQALTLGAISTRPLAAACADGRVRVWCTATGALLQTLSCHTDMATAVQWSPCGLLLASGSLDNTVALWELVPSIAGQLQCMQQGPEPAGATTPTPAGGQHGQQQQQQQAQHSVDEGSGGAADASSTPTTPKSPTVRLLRLRAVLKGHTGRVSSLAFSTRPLCMPRHIQPAAQAEQQQQQPQGQEQKQQEHQEQARQGQGQQGWQEQDERQQQGEQQGKEEGDQRAKVQEQPGAGIPGGSSSSSEAAPDGTAAGSSPGSMASTCGPGKARSAEGGGSSCGSGSGAGCQCDDKGSGERVVRLLLATGSTDSTARLWDADSLECLQVLRGHGGIITSISLSPCGRLLATASGDTRCKVWCTATGQALHDLAWESGGVNLCGFLPQAKLPGPKASPKSRILAKIPRSPAAAPVGVAAGARGAAVAAAAAAPLLLTAHIEPRRREGRILLWDVGAEGEEEGGSDSDSAASGCQQQGSLGGPGSRPGRAAAGGQEAAPPSAGTSSSCSHKDDGAAGPGLRPLQEALPLAQQPRAAAVAAAAAGAAAAAASPMSPAAKRRWRPLLGWVDGKLAAPAQTIDGFAGKITSWDACRGPEGAVLLAAACGDGVAHVYDVANGGVVPLFELSLEHGGLLTAGSAAAARDLPGWSLASLQAAANSRNQVAFEPGGQRLAVSGADHRVTVYDVESAEAVKCLLGHTKSLRALVWSGEGELVSAGEDGAIKVWRVGAA